jgi:hypothetical protein
MPNDAKLGLVLGVGLVLLTAVLFHSKELTPQRAAAPSALSVSPTSGKEAVPAQPTARPKTDVRAEAGDVR